MFFFLDLEVPKNVSANREPKSRPISLFPLQHPSSIVQEWLLATPVAPVFKPSFPPSPFIIHRQLKATELAFCLLGYCFGELCSNWVCSFCESQQPPQT